MDIQWPLVIFTVLTGLGGWLFFFVGLTCCWAKPTRGAFAGAVAALVLAIGGRLRVGHAPVAPRPHAGALQHPTSGIFTEAVLVGLLCITLVAFLVMLRRSIAGTPLKAVAIVDMALGVLMSFMAGQSYLMDAIAAWNTELLPLGYLGTAAAAGAAAYLVLIAAQKADESAVSFFGLMTLVAGAVSLVTTVAYGAMAGASSSRARVRRRCRVVRRCRAARLRRACLEAAWKCARGGAGCPRGRPRRVVRLPLRHVVAGRGAVRLLRAHLGSCRPARPERAGRHDGSPLPSPSSDCKGARHGIFPFPTRPRCGRRARGGELRRRRSRPGARRVAQRAATAGRSGRGAFFARSALRATAAAPSARRDACAPPRLRTGC